MFSKGTFLHSFSMQLHSLLKAVSSLIINKMIVVFLGSSALLFVGNLKSVFTILQQISGAGVYEGAVKYLSGEYKDRQNVYFRHAYHLCLLDYLFPLLFILFYTIKSWTFYSWVKKIVIIFLG